jgi:type III restriction enzyme
MSWIEFKSYQENAVVDLKREVKKLLDADGDKVCIFKAPTGSGKTLMMAEFLKRLIDSRIDGKKFSFVWIAVNKLHDQSRNNLRKYYDQNGTGIRCSYFEDLEDRRIRENEILFLNWASINKKDNLYVRANERDNNLSSVIARTKDDGRIIFLVIDESHHTASSEKSKELIQDIGPKITIEVSATPQLNNANRIVEVELKDVKDEEMIKKEIIINPGFEHYIIDKKKSDKSADELVLESALKKRIDLRKKLEAEGSSVNPLLLIQLPDAMQGVVDKKDEIIALLKKVGYTTENGRLAIYLSDKDNKINLANIEKNENEVDVMIFKQAIAIGWDCPRATILVLFRQWREENITFSIQTLGRIMRMPEQKHYADQDLNVGYVFTSLQDINVAEDLSRDYITTYSGFRITNYKDLDLLSYHSKRFKEETRLSSDFTPLFIVAGKKLKLKEKFSFKHSIIQTKLIASGRIIDADKETKSIDKKGTLNIPKNEVELQNAFDMFVHNNLAPFSPEQRSIGRVKASIYSFFEATRDEDQWPKIQAAVLAADNQQIVINTINLAKEMYQTEVGKGKNELLKNEKPWNVPKVINYTLSFAKKDYKKSVIQPYYTKKSGIGTVNLFEEDSDLEVDFIEYLEKSKAVDWWFKNGKSDATYFAVPHVEHGIEKPFYVDFVLMQKDGRIGLFDTKGGLTAETAKTRAEGLAKYIAQQNKNGKKLYGGIVMKEKNSWRYHDGPKYEYNPRELKEWKFLDLN